MVKNQLDRGSVGLDMASTYDFFSVSHGDGILFNDKVVDIAIKYLVECGYGTKTTGHSQGYMNRKTRQLSRVALPVYLTICVSGSTLEAEIS